MKRDQSSLQPLGEDNSQVALIRQYLKKELSREDFKRFEERLAAGTEYHHVDVDIIREKPVKPKRMSTITAKPWVFQSDAAADVIV